MSVDAPHLFPSHGTAVVIDDDVEVRIVVLEVLRQAGFDVHEGTTGLTGVEAVRESSPCVVTLNVDLPDIDGYEVLRRIREISDCYVVMLSTRTDEHDTLTALQSGADDYLCKPFRPRELRARIEAMLRRPRNEPVLSGGSSTQRPALKAATKQSAVFSRGELTLDPETRTVRMANREALLTKNEFNMLHEMLRNEGAVYTKAALVGVLRGADYRGYSLVSKSDERAIEVHMGNLRRKLASKEGPGLITTIRGVGYRIAPTIDVAIDVEQH